VTVAAELAGGSAGYPAVALLVFVGSVVPVVPTGAVVSAAVAYAAGAAGESLAAVLAIAALAAFAGDVLTFAASRLGGPRALRRLARIDSAAVDRTRHRLARRGSLLIVLGRLLPAGRIPVLAAAGVLAYPWGRFLAADAAAAAAWTAGYGALGLLGGGAFAAPWAAALTAAALVLGLEAAIHLVRRRRSSRVVGPRP